MTAVGASPVGVGRPLVVLGAIVAKSRRPSDIYSTTSRPPQDQLSLKSHSRGRVVLHCSGNRLDTRKGQPVADEKLVEAMIDQVRASVDHEIEDEHIERIRKGIDDKLDQGAALRKFPLENGDEPFTVFRAYRDES